MPEFFKKLLVFYVTGFGKMCPVIFFPFLFHYFKWKRYKKKFQINLEVICKNYDLEVTVAFL